LQGSSEIIELLLLSVKDIKTPFLYRNILLISVIVAGVVKIFFPFDATISL
jgi:hypothetical protein